MSSTISSSYGSTSRAAQSSKEEDAVEFDNDLKSGKFFFDQGQGRVADAASAAVTENTVPGGATKGGKGAKATGSSKTAQAVGDISEAKAEESDQDGKKDALAQGAAVALAAEGGSLTLPMGG